MRKRPEEYLEDLYQNCMAHAEDTMEFWEKATDAFYRLTDAAHDQELTQKAVEKYMKIQNHVLGGRA